MTYLYNVFFSFDQLANSIAGGTPDNTISSRIGYHCQNAGILTKWYWVITSKLIDLTFFLPTNEKHYCKRAFRREEDFGMEKGNDLIRVLLCLLALVFCPLICVLLYPLRWAGIMKVRQRSNLQEIESNLLGIKRLIKRIELNTTKPTEWEREIPDDFLDELLK